WNNSKYHPREHRDDRREPQDGRVDVDATEHREEFCRRGFDERRAPDRGENAERSARERKQQTFREELADKPIASGTKRGADRDLLVARRRTREQKIADIRARDQKHETDGAE